MHSHRTAEQSPTQLRARAEVLAGRAQLAQIVRQLEAVNQALDRDPHAALELVHAAEDTIDLNDAFSQIIVGAEALADAPALAA